MCLFVVCLLFCLSEAYSQVVCRVSETERVTCPEDFQCCGVDQCCQLTFGDPAGRVDKMDDWLTALCIRTLIVCVFMGALYMASRSIQFCKRRYLGAYCSEETNLPRYKPLGKNTIATDIDTISAIIGSSFYSVGSDRVESCRVNAPL